jgi:cell division protein FtsB
MPSADAPRTRAAGRNRPSGGPRSGARGQGGGGRSGPAASRGGRGGVRTLSRDGAAPDGKARGTGPRGTTGESIRDTRASRVAAATQGILGVSSTRRAAVLALVVCALALTVAVPLRNYLSQREELSALSAEQQQKTQQLQALTQRANQLRDPAYVQAEARERLGYVRAGEIPFVVQLPGDDAAAQAGPGPEGPSPWFDKLWSDVRGAQP